ncbi:ATP-binding protein [Adlercreutzia sp. ZJ138]|uniref:ATP-binding protein n=1 Tax=Adlercreutzia sp. ZJ138 TaxID=2709405 RepID=UPI0013EAEA35|nr:AAA family ATPase [Adlercreutzia sp. ZJ138]
MIERKAYAKLLKWKEESPYKALLVDGARQIGKTYLVEEFARREFSSYVKVDFLRDERAPYLSQATSARDLIERLSLMVGREVIPGETLVFFDEVQETPNLVTLSKYLVQDGRFRLVMSGSLLGVALKHVKSFPVGYLHIETMFPLDFEEFCKSQGVTDSLWQTMREHFETETPLEASLHERLTKLFRLYIVVGGMPEAVDRYSCTHGDLGAVRDVHTELVGLYREDIAKYAKSRTLQVASIYDAMPSQLDKENKRFELRSLKEKATFERYANDFAWLVSAGAALKVPNVSEPKCPLKRTEEQNRFKLYAGDTGMLVSRYPISVAMAIVSGASDVNFGGVYENVIAQELASAFVVPRYYRHSRRGEVDFIGETPSRQVVPIEVKSGKAYKRHVALTNLLSSSEYAIENAYVFSEANVSVEKREEKTVHYMPLYLAPFAIEKLAAEGIDAQDELSRMGCAAETLLVPPPSFADFA